MKICLLSAAEAQKAHDPDFVPDCHSHDHLSKRDAHQAAADGKVRFVSRRAVVAVSSALSGYWYDRAVRKNDRYLGTAKSGPVRTTQLLKSMPRGMKRRVRDVGACGAHGRLMTARAVNAPSLATNCGGDQSGTMKKLVERRKKACEGHSQAAEGDLPMDWRLTLNWRKHGE